MFNVQPKTAYINIGTCFLCLFALHYSSSVSFADEESDIPSSTQMQNSGINEINEAPIEKSTVQETALSGLIGMLDTYDRPASATAEGSYANQDAYAKGFKHEPGERIPKAGYSAEVGFGRARAEASIFEAEARGPNASAKAEASLTKVEAMGRAEVVSVSGKAGPVAAKLGVGFDTGASVGLDGVEIKFLGTGFSFGPKMGVSVLGSEASASCSVM